MNSSLLGKRFFSALYNYSSHNNPKVYLTFARGSQSIGDVVFEVYQNHCPTNADNFIKLCTGRNPNGISYKGTKLDGGAPGMAVHGGQIEEVVEGAEGLRVPEEGVATMRHFKRGMLSMYNEGENASGSRFMITLDKAEVLDGYQTVLGEVVEGDSVLKEIEELLSRSGHFKEEIKIEACGLV